MSKSKTVTQLGKAKKFSDFRCVICHRYLVPCTEEKMILFNLTSEQKETISKHGLNYFCPVCMRGYQRTHKRTEIKQYKPTPYPINAEEVTTKIKTKSGMHVKIYSQKKPTVERFDYAPNPNLKKILKFNNLVIYQFKDSGDFAVFTHHPERKPIWTKLDNHDVESLEAFCLAYHRQFRYPIPRQLWIGRRLRRKIEKICEAVDVGKILEKLSRKNHCSG